MPNPSTYHPNELLIRIAKQDVTAFDELYHALYEDLYRDAYKRLKDQAACKDILQDVFLDLWQRASSVAIGNIEGYLHTAVRYQVFNYMAKNKVQSFYEVLDEMKSIPPDAPSNLDYKDLQLLLDLWIETLPPKRKEIFLLHYREQLSTREIADRLQLAQKSVQNQLGIAFNDFREKLPGLVLFMLVHRF